MFFENFWLFECYQRKDSYYDPVPKVGRCSLWQVPFEAGAYSSTFKDKQFPKLCQGAHNIKFDKNLESRDNGPNGADVLKEK